jgi:hypothetical protein
MRDRAYRCSSICIVVFAVLLTLPSVGAAQERVPAARAKAAFDAVAPPQARCNICSAAYQRCAVGCFGLKGKGEMATCLTACDNAAATCTCDQEVGLRSEDVAAWRGLNLSKAACHGTVSCQPAYPSCASWSGYSACDDPYCDDAPHCDPDCEFGTCPGPAWHRSQERFRVCFDQYANPCTEWQTIFIKTCGC